jgi:hypothetical protein
VENHTIKTGIKQLNLSKVIADGITFTVISAVVYVQP